MWTSENQLSRTRVRKDDSKRKVAYELHHSIEGRGAMASALDVSLVGSPYRGKRLSQLAGLTESMPLSK